MENTRDQVVKRLKILRKQFSPSADFNRELSGSSVNYDMAYKIVRALRPEIHHQTTAVVDSMIKWHRFHEMPKLERRQKTNIGVKNVIDALYKKKIFTPELVANDPDLLNRCTMGISFLNGELTTKYAVHVGLYVKSLKNIGTEIHHDALMKGAKFEEWG